MAIAVAPGRVHAQPDLIDEIVVGWDTAGRLDRIDAELLRRLEREDPDVGVSLGAGAPGERFVDAHLLRGADSTYVLDTLVQRGGDLVHRRRNLSSTEAGALLQRVRAALSIDNPRGLASDNRTLLVVGSSLLGLAFYDWALPVASEAEGKEAVAAGMFAAAASFFGPYLATRGNQVSAGEANLALYGGTRGIPHGILAYYGFRPRGTYASIDYAGNPITIEDEGDSDNALASAVAASVLEGIGGFFWARGSNLSGSTAHTIGVGGDIGLLWGLGYVELLDGGDVDFDLESNRPLCIGGLAGSGLGMAFGSMTSSRRSHTWGDIEVVRMSSFVGATTGLAIGDLVSDKDNPILVGALAGSAAGLVLGDRFVRDIDLSSSQSILIDAGTLAGAALGLGIAYLVTSNGSDESEAYVSAAALGAISGGAATFLAVRRSAARDDSRRGNVQLQFSPHALLAPRRSTQDSPFVQVSWTF